MIATYTLSDFPNGKIDSDSLTEEINDSSITRKLEQISTNDQSVSISFLDTLTAEDSALLDAIVASHQATPQEPAAAVTYVQAVPAIGQEIRFITGNWCDKTTWWYNSERQTDIGLTKGPDGVWVPDEEAIIVDVTHGKVTKEIPLREKYAAVVRVNGIVKKEHDPDKTNGDYAINYRTGAVTFSADIGDADVRMDRSLVKTGTWIARPLDGKSLHPVKTKTIFSAGDVEMRDSIEFQVYAETGKFPPFEPYRQENGGPYPDGTMLPISEPITYQTVGDLITEADATYSEFPSVGLTWRALHKPVNIVEWKYPVSIPLRSDWGMELHIGIENDIEFGGTIAVTTIYFVVGE